MVIAVPAITNSSKKTKEKMLKTKVELAEQSLMLWSQNNKKCFVQSSGSGCLNMTCTNRNDIYTCTTTMKDMANTGIIKYDEDNKVINPVDKSDISSEQFIISYNSINKSISISGDLLSSVSPDATTRPKKTTTSRTTRVTQTSGSTTTTKKTSTSTTKTTSTTKKTSTTTTQPPVIVIPNYDETPPVIKVTPNWSSFYRNQKFSAKVEATDAESGVQKIKLVITNSIGAIPAKDGDATEITSGQTISASTPRKFLIVRAWNNDGYASIVRIPMYYKSNIPTGSPYKTHISLNSNNYIYIDSSKNNKHFRNYDETNETGPSWSTMDADEVYLNYKILDDYVYCYSLPQFDPDYYSNLTVKKKYTANSNVWLRPYYIASEAYSNVVNWYKTDTGCYISGEAFKAANSSGGSAGTYTLSTKSGNKNCYAFRKRESGNIIKTYSGSNLSYYYAGSGVTSFFYSYDYNCFTHGDDLQ